MGEPQDPTVRSRVVARAVAREYIAAFNARDLERSRAVLNFPSLRLASGEVRIWERPEDYSIPWDLLTEREGWHRSTLDSAEVVQAGCDTAHVAASFSRYDAQDVRYASDEALWVITKLDGHWGIQFRSSSARAQLVLDIPEDRRSGAGSTAGLRPAGDVG